MQVSQIKPQLTANGVNLVAIGLEQIGVEEFIKKKFFDGGRITATLNFQSVMYFLSFTTDVYIDEVRQCYKDLDYKR